VFLTECRPTFQRNVLPPSPGSPSAFPGPLIKEGKHGGRSTFWATKKLAELATDLHCVRVGQGQGRVG
jgi:hypothetical protein